MSLSSQTAMLRVFSFDVDCNDATESEIRILMGDQVRYILVDPGIYGADILSFPPDLFAHLPPSPLGNWKTAHVSHRSEGICVDFSSAELQGVKTQWHHNMIDVLSLATVKRHNARVSEIHYGSGTAICKIARFWFEIPWVETETRLYQTIEGHNIGPAFLGHLTEHGRIIGFMTERLGGRPANIDDLAACEFIVKKPYALGITHRDLNKYNSLVS